MARKKAKEGYHFCTKCGEELPFTRDFFYYYKKPFIMQSACIRCSNIISREWKKVNTEYCKNYGKEYLRNHKDQKTKRVKAYREKNRDEINKRKKTYTINRYRTEPRFNINVKITNSMRTALKGNKSGRHWEDLVGYTLDQLMDRLKETMPTGYNWDDVLTARLEIDHIIPKDFFDYESPNQRAFIDCWALNNLQLLSREENIKKSNHYPYKATMGESLIL